jgi:hypothetical protein
MATTLLTALPITSEEDAVGTILGECRLYTYQARSDIPLPTYQDVQCQLTNTSPGTAPISASIPLPSNSTIRRV